MIGTGLYNKLLDWQIRFDSHGNSGLEDILEDQVRTCNKEFSYFIEKTMKTGYCKTHLTFYERYCKKICLS